MTSIVDRIKEKYKLNETRTVQDFDDFLQYAMVTTTSFQGILDGKLNPRNRFFQFLLLVFIFVYAMPRYSIICYLYTQDNAKRSQYLYLLADYGEEMGLLGKAINICFLVFGSELSFNLMILRKYECKASLEYLTDWLSRTPKYTRTKTKIGNSHISESYGDPQEDLKHELVSHLHSKTVVAKMLAGTLYLVRVYEIIAFALFLYNRRPSLIISCLAVFNCSTIVLCFTFPAYHFHALYLSFLAVSDYFKIRINLFTQKVLRLQTIEFQNQNLTHILHEYNELMSVFKKYDKVLKPLLRNLVQFYAFGLTVMLFACFVEAESWMLSFVMIPVIAMSFVILGTGLYVSELNTLVLSLHNQLASVPAKHSRNKSVSLKNMLRLRLVIKELGNLQTDGQFVLGLRDGEGPATSRLEIFQLTLTTLTNTLMMFDFLIV